MSTETDIQREIMRYLNAHPDVTAWRVNVRGVRNRRAQNRGMSDIVGLIAPSGRMLAVEVKKPGSRYGGGQSQETKAAQEAFRTAVETRGGLFIRATSVEDVAHELP